MNETVQINKLDSFKEFLQPTNLIQNQNALNDYREFLNNNDFPTTRNEKWKYTRLTKISSLQPKFDKASIDSIEKYKVVQNAVNLVFINGFYSKELSSNEFPQGLTIKSLSECPEELLLQFKPSGTEDAQLFTALNWVYLQDGLFIKIDPKVDLSEKIQIISVITGTQSLANPRILVEAGSFSKAHIIQGFFSENANQTLTNWANYIHVEDNAFLKIDKIQFEEETSFQISEDFIKQEANSNFTINTITLNGGLVRNNLNISVLGQNAETHLNGAYLLKGNQHVDNHTIVDHKVAHCESNELYKGVVDDKATAVFNGKVFVRKDAQKINAFQSNANVLLSDSATVNSKPELEIYADDVKCSHGSTTGQLDEEAIFYLRARGISEKSARQLMVSAFIEDVLEKLDDEEILSFIHEILKDRFNWSI